MATIAVYSMKGGVGKTTLAVNLAWSSAMQSARRTLLWDLDPQGGASFLIGDGTANRDTAQSVFSKDVDPATLIRPSTVKGLTCSPRMSRCAGWIVFSTPWARRSGSPNCSNRSTNIMIA